MTTGKASDFKLQESAFGGSVAKRPLDSSYITLSSDSITDAASVGDTLGTLSITAAYVGTPRWEMVGQSNFAVNSSTGVVTVAHALTAGSDQFKVKLRGTTPPINSPTFAITIADTGGGGGGYVAGAVHFDGAVYLRNAGLTVANSSVFSFSFWCNALEANAGTPWFIETPGAGPSNTAFFTDDASNLTLGAAGASPAAGDYQASYGVAASGWHHVMGSLDANHEAGAKISALYLDDVLQTPSVFDPDSALVLPFSGTECGVGALSSGGGAILTGDMADLWVAPGISLLSGSTISEATRRLFISADGKPVDPSGFPASAVLLSGDETTFSTNQGSGGAFSIEGGSLINATTSPSD